ncbi:MAG: hypothetical protein GY853_02235 [PVC group bacterium]|nr:hypothetical protein [PVC group bacterium]
MVDFNSEAAFSADKFHINNLLSIQRHAYAIDSLEKYERLKMQGASAPSNIVKASIKALFRQVKANFKAVDKENYKEVLELLESSELKSYMEAFDKIDDWLNESGTIRFVRIKNYDPSDPLAEDEAFGL